MEISRLTDNTNLYNVVKDSTDLSPGLKRPLGITHCSKTKRAFNILMYMRIFNMN